LVQIFFHIFKRYYKSGQYRNDIPWLTATGIISVSTFLFMTGVCGLIYYFLISKNVPELTNIYTVFGIVFTTINYLWFTYKKRYLKIYEEYRASNKNNRIIEVISWVYLVMGFASVPITALIIR
jgi:hypothetical protein